MKIKINPSSLSGKVEAPASKSVAHRMLICAALAKGKSIIELNKTSDDIEATANCLRSLGVIIEKNGNSWTITPPEAFPDKAELDCGESGSTLRFMLPVVSALGVEATFICHGRLPSRPIAPLLDEMKLHGVSCDGEFPLHVSGRLKGGKFTIAGNISSQFITGLLLALPLCEEESEIEVIPPIESKPYINITTKILSSFGTDIEENGNVYKIRHSDLRSGAFRVEGDWSNAAFLLALGAEVSGLDSDSAQGDKKILDVFRSFGAEVSEENGTVRVSLANLHGAEIDASDIPDLVPVICAIAATAEGTTKISNASRLRLKESDRIRSTAEMVNSLGGDAHETDDGIIIKGKKDLSGGTVDSFNDHRIVMSAAVASQKCEGYVIINDAQAVNKSYPEFFEDFNSLGGDTDVM